jgi:hypothetical protein
MEAAPDTWSQDGADVVMQWCSVVDNEIALLTTGTQASIQTLTAIGSGFRNTKMMLGTCTFGAANMAASYNGGGKSDWFLPSKDELNQLFLQKTVFGALKMDYHWSSSEGDVSNAWVQHFTDGTQTFNRETAGGYIRPVRAF